MAIIKELQKAPGKLLEDFALYSALPSLIVYLLREPIKINYPGFYKFVHDAVLALHLNGHVATLIVLLFATKVLLVFARWLAFCKDYLPLFGFVGRFFWNLLGTCQQDDACKKRIFEAVMNKKATCSIDIQIKLDDYQDTLLELTDNNKSVKALKWTNIVPPAKVWGRAHNNAFGKFDGAGGRKIRICIIGSENYEEWDKEFVDSNGKCILFENDSKRNNGELVYASESVLKNEYKDSISLGDFAILEQDNCRAMMVSYNPITEDRELGEVSFTFGDLGRYPKIFELCRQRNSGVAGQRAFFDSYPEASKTEKNLLAEAEKKRVEAEAERVRSLTQ